MIFTKRALALMMALVTVCLCLSGCQWENDPDQDGNQGTKGIAVRLAVSQGAMAMTAVNLRNSHEAKTTHNTYTLSLTQEAEAARQLQEGKVDAAVVSTDMAARLYAQTGGKVQILAVANTGWLHIVESGNELREVADLSGKTLYATGQGGLNQVILEYVLTKNGLTAGEDVVVQWVQSEDELATLLQNGTAKVAMMSDPALSVLRNTKPTLRVAMDLTDIWAGDKATSSMAMGCLVASRAFVEENTDGVSLLLQDFESSIARGDALREETAALCVKYGVLDNETVAATAIVGCGLEYTGGIKMKDKVAGYLKGLHQVAPATVGGNLPGDDFYFIGTGDKA